MDKREFKEATFTIEWWLKFSCQLCDKNIEKGTCYYNIYNKKHTSYYICDECAQKWKSKNLAKLIK